MALLTKLAAKLTLDTKGYRKGLQTAENKTGTFAKGIGKLGPSIAAAFSTGVIIKFGTVLSDLNKDISNSTRAFERFGDAKLLTELRNATGGMVNKLKLMQQAIQAVNLNLNAADLPAFFKFATIRAAETGMEVDHLVESIVTGIGRESRLVLDNLGISLIALNKEIAKGGTFAEAATRLIKRVADESNTSVEQATKGTKLLSAAWSNLIIKFSKSETFNTLNDNLMVFAGWLDIISKNTETIVRFFKYTSTIGSVLGGVAVSFFSNLADDLERVNDASAKIPDWLKDQLVGRGNKVSDDPVQPPFLDYIAENRKVELERLIKELKLAQDAPRLSPDKIKEMTLQISLYQQELDSLLKVQKDPAWKEGPKLSEFDVKVDPSSVNGLMEYRGQLESLRDALPSTSTEFADLAKEIERVNQAILVMTDPLAVAAQTFQDTVIDLDLQPTINKVNELGAALEGLAENGLVAIGELLGELIAGDENALENFIGNIAGLLKQFGAMLISFGIARKVMESGNAYAMIAAGVALVAIGSAMSSKQNQISAVAGGSVGGGSYSSGSVGGGEYDYNREIIMVARGNDLVGILNNTNQKQQYLGGI